MTSATPAPAPLEALLRERAWVIALARHLAQDVNVGDDLAQDAFVAALERPPRVGAVRGWFATVLRHGAMRHARGVDRRSRREHAAARGETIGSAAEAVERAEAHERVVRALLALDEPYRTALVLRFFEDLPPREIGRRTGVGAETARSRVQRGVALLRGRLGADDDPRSRRAAWLLVALPASAGVRGGPIRGALAVGTKTKLAAVAALACVVISFVAIAVQETFSTDGRDAGSIDGTESAGARSDTERRPRGANTAPGAAGEAAEDAPVVPRAPRPVHGTVVTAGGMPVGGARVTSINPASLLDPVPPDEEFEEYRHAVVRRLRTMINFDSFEDVLDEPAPAGVATTAADGTFVLDDTGSDTASLRVTAHGHAASVVARLPPLGQGALVRLQTEAAVEGLVRDDVGDPVAGRYVHVLGTRLASAVTGSDGRYRIGGLSAGTWPVALAEAWNWRSVADAAAVEFRSGTVSSHDFLVLGRRMRVLTGTVVRGNAPVAGATVRVEGQPGDQVTTDARGRFRMDALLTDMYVVCAVEEGPDGVSAGCAELVLDSPSATEPVVVELSRVYRTGRVVDAATGAPVRGAEVIATVGNRFGTWWPADVRGAGRTDAEGRFRVSGPAEGNGVLTVSADGYAPSQEGFIAADAQPTQIELGRGREVRVTVVRDEVLSGRPLLVFAQNYGCAPSLGVNGALRAGETVIVRVPWDVGWLYVLSDDTVPCLRELSEKDSDVEVRLVTAGSLRVGVLDRRGEPFAGASVGLALTGGSGVPDVPLNPWRPVPDYVTWREGSVTRHGLPPGRYMVSASSPTGVSTTGSVDVVAGSLTELDLKLE